MSEDDYVWVRKQTMERVKIPICKEAERLGDIGGNLGIGSICDMLLLSWERFLEKDIRKRAKFPTFF